MTAKLVVGTAPVKISTEPPLTDQTRVYETWREGSIPSGGTNDQGKLSRVQG